MRLSYTEQAVNDLYRLHQFIAEHNPTAASRIASELLDAIQSLTISPRLGRKVRPAPDPDAIRDLFTSGYVVRYLLLGNEITILRIWHQREDWKSLL